MENMEHPMTRHGRRSHRAGDRGTVALADPRGKGAESFWHVADKHLNVCSVTKTENCMRTDAIFFSVTLNHGLIDRSMTLTAYSTEISR